jgi:plastocyanin
VATVLAFCIAPGEAQGTGTIEIVVSIERDGRPKPDRSNVALYLDGVPGHRPEPVNGVIHQKNRTFRPDVTVVTVGSTIEFPNDDMIYHNVFSLSRASRFDLGLYRAGASKTVSFRRAGVVDIYCNIHPEMAAKVKVIDTSLYAVTGRDGRARIAEAPEGTHTLVAWQAYGDEVRRQVAVRARQTTRVTVELVEGDRETRHMRKDGSPYGRYQ